jgi:hypothetical protein
MSEHPLSRLEGLPLGVFSLELSVLEPMRMSGWRHFSIILRDPSGSRSIEPVIDGIHSLGGKGIHPWVEIAHFNGLLTFGDNQEIDIREERLDYRLFRILHDLLEPGSHIMVWYEGKSGKETELELQRGIPPLITPLGMVIFTAGFLSIRDFHLPEGGHEGGRKLWGERPLNEAEKEGQKEKILRETVSYFVRPIRVHLIDLELDARARVLGIYRRLGFHKDCPEIYRRFRETYSGLRGGRIPAEDWTGLLGNDLEDFYSGNEQKTFVEQGREDQW